MKSFADMDEAERDSLLSLAETAVKRSLPDDVEYIVIIGNVKSQWGGLERSATLSPRRLQLILQGAYKQSVAQEAEAN